MARKKGKKRRASRRSTASLIAGRLQNMQAAAGAVALYGVELLKRLPHGFESLAEGQGKKPTKNKRVLILVGVLLFLITRRDLKWKLWSIPVTALLTLAVQQHRLTYQEDAVETTELTEAYG